LSLAFKPPWWCRNRHAQTLLPWVLRRRLKVGWRRETLELADGDFLNLDWSAATTGPIVLMLHGLEGSNQSHYTKGLALALQRAGFRTALLNFRGSHQQPNRLPRAYHSGETGDMDFVARLLKQREPTTTLFALGFSLGGNALLKWLGEDNKDKPVAAACVVSAPFLLDEAAVTLNKGTARIYQHYLLNNLKKSLLAKAEQVSLPLDTGILSTIKTIADYDEYITSPLHGFKGADDYYTQCSSRQFLKNIRTPTLICHARDDPFMSPQVAPARSELPENIDYELHDHGGHVGFIERKGLLGWRYWLDERIPEFFHERLSLSNS